MKGLVIGGVPASGKTTLMRLFLNTWDQTKPVKHGLVYGYLLGQETLLLGKYESKEVFAGTDRLSMAVQPDFQTILDSKKYNIVFEGDRLFIEKNLISLCSNYDTRVIILDASEGELKRRHLNRGDGQSEIFLKSRETKINNILKNHLINSHSEYYRLESIAEATALSQDMSEWITGINGKR
tara:strand:+ start:324 stop:869 length:546 start_codon:yes stop_codon:yes gene_type:complete